MAQETIAWHPGFSSAFELELEEVRKMLGFEKEHTLNQRPLLIDLLIVKKEQDVVIENELASIFRGHNILEFKSEQDSLTIDDFCKAMGYCCLYKAYGETVDAIHLDDVTLTLARHRKPMGLFASLQEYGMTMEQTAPGIYGIGGTMFPTQVVVTSELDPNRHIWLSSLSSNLGLDQLRNLVAASRALEDKHDRELADSLLDVVARANTDMLERLKEEDEMGKSLYEIMKPEIDEAVRQGREQAMKEGLREGLAAGLEQGLERGRTQGLNEGIRATVERMLDRGDFSEEEIAQLAGTTVERVRAIAAAGTI